MIDYKIDGKVTTITLNRPDKRNALNLELLRSLNSAIKRASDSRVIVIRGAGKVFCAGLDLTEDYVQESADLIASILKSIYIFQGITVAVVQGAALAGGAGLMVACDVVIAEKNALFGFPEVHRGLVPAQVMAFLIQQLNQRDLRELVLLGETINAEKAKEIGLINSIVSISNLEDEIQRVIELALLGAPQAIKETKAVIEFMSGKSFEQNLKKGLEIHLNMRDTNEAKEGMCAFFDKRKPNWVNTDFLAAEDKDRAD